MRALCLLALALLSAAPASQDPPLAQRTGRDVLPVPFLFERREKPSPGFTKGQLEAWLDAVARHQPGEFDETARATAALGGQALADVIAAFERIPVPLDERLAKIDTLRRAVVLHTDVALAAAEQGYLDAANQATQASLHMGAALELVEALGRETAAGAEDPFVYPWWRAVAAVLGEHRESVSAVPFMARAVARYPADPDILLMAGTVSQLAASPVVQDDTETEGGWRDDRRTEAQHLQAAEQRFRKALEIEPDLVEARVRLGRVLAGRQQYEAAVAELTAVANAGTEPRLRYYRDLSLGEAEEGRRHVAAAREAYRRALALYPGAQSAHLALARLERASGLRPRALDAVRTLLRRSTREDARQDPWREYFVAAPARQSAEWLERLRAPLRRQP